MSCTQTVELQPLSTELSDGRRSHSEATNAHPVAQNADDLIATLALEPVPTDSTRVFQASDVAPSAQVQDTARYGIVLLLVTANLIQFVSNFLTFTGGLTLSKALHQPVGDDKANWMAASYSLTQGAFVLVSGRLGTIYGHQRVALIGLFIFAFFSLINGFCRSFDAFIAFRALSGIGGGIYMPNAVSLLTLMVRPGKARNMLIGLFAAAPPTGGLIGAMFAGLCAKWAGMASWNILFGAIAGSSILCFGLLWYLFPKEHPLDKNGRIDFVGACLGLSSLILFNVTWNQAPAVGWSTPYEIAMLLISVLLFAGLLVWERFYAVEPIMPLDVFRAPTFFAITFVVLFGYMAFGITLWYAISWQQVLRHMSVLDIGLTCIPFGLGSLVAVALAAYLLPRVSAKWVMALGIAVIVAASLILATMPVHQSFWPQVFPAMVLSGFCPDFVYVAAQVIASNSVSRKHQGVASSLVGTLNLYGVSLGLGFAGTIAKEVTKTSAGAVVDEEEASKHVVAGFRAALYFSAALAAVALLLDFAFVRLPKAELEDWDEAIENEQDTRQTDPARTDGLVRRTVQHTAE